MVERIHTFQRRLERAAAERAVPTEHGVVLLTDSAPDVYDANYLAVERAAPADELAAETDAALESRFHRRLTALDAGEAATAAFAGLGFEHASHLILAHRREPDRLVDTSMVREVPFAAIAPARIESTIAEPWGSVEIARQLNVAHERVIAAVPTVHFAAFAGGEVAGYCELRSSDGVAQIEDVEVLLEHRGHGLGRAVVQHALEHARAAGNEVVFLEALADDWPRLLYAKLGFDEVGRRDVFTRLPHALTRLRVTTPRLELRLATVAELRELYAVAAAGIHDPAEMPFGIAWTDSLEEASFLAFHDTLLAGWRPDDWSLNLVAFHEGRPVGSQSLRGHAFRETREVETGSWLGRAWQGRGLGTEMRAAVLTLAFDGLGAEVARSGAIAGNPQSLGVSRKLGYEEAGSHLVSPRGEPVEHADLELRRDRFASPVRVDVSGLDPTLFGVSR